MMNMAYCRFNNTLMALQECAEHWDDEDLSDTEKAARKRLQRLVNNLAEDPDE